MDKINFNQSVGFPFATQVLDFMQKSYSLFNALGAVSGDFSIIKGCITTGTNVSDGVVYINGEILSFKGGSLSENVIIVENKEAREFKDLETRDVYYTRYATFGVSTVQWPWSSFRRGMPTVDVAAALASKAVQTDVDQLTTAINTMITKLNTIETDAQKNVKPDWNAASGNKAEILNTPAVLSPFLYKGSYAIGDVTSVDITRIVNIPDVGTTNYMVLGAPAGASGNWDANNDVIATPQELTRTSFRLSLREVAPNTQDLVYNFVIIAL